MSTTPSIPAWVGFLIFGALLAGCEAPPAAVAPDPTLRARAFPSPDGRASFVYRDSLETDVARLDRVLLATEGDTTEVFAWELGRSLGLDWPAADLGRIWIPIGGNYHHASVFVEPSSRRVSPWLEDDIAVDGAAGTVVTFDAEAFTLRDLWSGVMLAAWAPPGLDLMELQQACEPTATLAGRAAMLRYDCGDGEQERRMDW